MFVLKLCSVHCNKAIDISFGQCNDGTNLHLWTVNETPAQRFKFVQHVNQNPTNVVVSTTPNNVQTVNPIEYEIVETQLCGNNEMVLDVEHGNAFPGANIQLYTANDTGAQSWNIIYL